MSDNLTNITISDLVLWVHLGCSEEERFHPQSVSFDIIVSFMQPPKATINDDLNDTFCYAKAVQLIKKSLKGRHFNLIEHLAATIHDILSDTIKKQNLEASVSVTITKLSPPIPDIHGGVSFTYSGE